MRWKFYSFLVMFLVPVLIATSCSPMPNQYYDDRVSDEEYIRIASDVEEAQVFLEKFPTSEKIVDRSSKLAVDIRVSQVSGNRSTQHWEGIRLRVFINPIRKQAADMFIQCNDESGKTNFFEEDLIWIIEQYAINQSCPDVE